jgi:phosphoglycolate phosphatase
MNPLLITASFANQNEWRNNANMPDLGYESDFHVRVEGDVSGEFLDGTSIEIMREPEGRGDYHHVLFDFDGTLSLIREGWPEIMCPMMVELLMDTPNHESQAEIEAVVKEFVS